MQSPSSLRQNVRIEYLLLRQILKKVSRSFYLSLIILPVVVRQQVSLAYLFCRIADTIADTRLLPLHKRRRALDIFREQFLLTSPSLVQLEELQHAVLSHQGGEGERQLLLHLSDCFRIFESFASYDQQFIRELVLTLTRGMEMDLYYFPEGTVAMVHALPDLTTLDLYTYYVAGVVGEFWTKIHIAHLSTLGRCDSEALCKSGVRFGKGLQLTNILKDLAKDLHHGRCYLPQEQLTQLHVQVDELCKPETLTRIRPLIFTLIWRTLEYLEDGYEYVICLPMLTFRLRLSCVWPLLFALQTLEAVCTSEALLQPYASVKISRRAVYWTLFWSTSSLLIPGLFPVYYRRLRQRLISTLHRQEKLAV
jgi:farnesyl-diphosphate farnesyltransferase